MIDKNGKLFSKISVIDIIIVLAIILCIGAAFIRFSGLLGDNTTTPVNIEYTVKVERIREKSADAFMKKGSLYSSLSDATYLGEIVDVAVKPNESYDTLVDGTIAKTSATDRYDVYVTVKSDGKQTQTALYTSNGKHIQLGATEYIATKWVAAESKIVNVKISE